MLLHEIGTRSLIHATPKFVFFKVVPNSAQHPVCVYISIYTYTQLHICCRVKMLSKFRFFLLFFKNLTSLSLCRTKHF